MYGVCVCSNPFHVTNVAVCDVAYVLWRVYLVLIMVLCGPAVITGHNELRMRKLKKKYIYMSVCNVQCLLYMLLFADVHLVMCSSTFNGGLCATRTTFGRNNAAAALPMNERQRQRRIFRSR